MLLKERGGGKCGKRIIHTTQITVKTVLVVGRWAIPGEQG